MHVKRLVALCFLTATLATLSTGCALTGQGKSEDVGDAVEQATKLSDAGETAKAIEVLDRAAKDAPASAAPWVKKAQIQFQAADYPSAIQSAEQASRRDPGNKDARSISIVSALRIAIGGLAELRGQQNTGDNAYVEAQRMVEVLRSSLGTEALVPAEEATASGLVTTEPAAAAPAVPPKRKPVTRPVTPKPVVKKDAPVTEPPAAGTDPFKDLK